MQILCHSNITKYNPHSASLKLADSYWFER